MRRITLFSPRRASSQAAGGAAVDPSSAGAARSRLEPLDALRGLAIVILLLVNTTGISGAMPEQLSHPEWHGFTFIDAFFPVFLFSMGAAMELSRRARLPLQMLRRVFLLFVLGAGLSSLRQGELVVMPGILQKIAIAYLLTWLVLKLPRWTHLPLGVGVLALLWAAFLWVPAPGVVPGSWEQGTNILAFVDRTLIGHPATEGPATAIPATVNVLGGAIVVRYIRGRDPREALKTILLWAVGAIALGLALDGLVPINKRIWTPSFTILSHGMACMYLAVFWVLSEVRGWRRPAQPPVALGRNPILIYVLFTAGHELVAPLRVPAMDRLAGVVGGLTASLTWSALMIVSGWALAAWLNRRGTYIRI